MNKRLKIIFILAAVLVIITFLLLKKFSFGNGFLNSNGNESTGNVSLENLCNNGILNEGEDCDCVGEDCIYSSLVENKCSEIRGFQLGFFECSDCSFNLSLCKKEGVSAATESSGSGSGSSSETGPVCGNSVKETSENCDDGNTVSGDGCSSSCTLESGWTCRENSDELTLCGAENCSIVYSDTGYNSSYLVTYINEVISNASTNNVSCVYLTQGNFTVNDKIIMASNVTLEGAGMDETNILGINEPYPGIISYGTKENGMIYTIQNLNVEGTGNINYTYYNGNPSANGIYIASNTTYPFEEINILNVSVKNILGGGIFATVSKNITIENCYVENSNFVAYTPVGEYINILNSRADRIRIGMEADGRSYSNDTNFTSFNITNFSATNLFMYGIKSYGSGVMNLTNITLSGDENFNLSSLGTSSYGFYLSSSNSSASVPLGNFTADDFEIRHLEIGVTFDQILYNGSVENFAFTNGIIYDIYYSGISLAFSNFSVISGGINIINNTITQVNKFGAFISGSAIKLQNVTNLVIDNNIVTSNQTAASKAIPVGFYGISDIINITNNNFTNSYTTPSIWITSNTTNITLENNTGIAGLYTY